MGFKKWLLKHGPGSIGATAKAISKTYIRIKKSNPQASQDELLLLTLKTRMMGRRIAGYTSFAPEEQKEWIGKTEGGFRKGSLSALIYLIIRNEYPRASRGMLHSFDVIEVIREIIDKYVPEDN